MSLLSDMSSWRGPWVKGRPSGDVWLPVRYMGPVLYSPPGAFKGAPNPLIKINVSVQHFKNQN